MCNDLTVVRKRMEDAASVNRCTLHDLASFVAQAAEEEIGLGRRALVVEVLAEWMGETGLRNNVALEVIPALGLHELCEKYAVHVERYRVENPEELGYAMGPLLFLRIGLSKLERARERAEDERER